MNNRDYGDENVLKVDKHLCDGCSELFDENDFQIFYLDRRFSNSSQESASLKFHSIQCFSGWFDVQKK